MAAVLEPVATGGVVWEDGSDAALVAPPDTVGVAGEGVADGLISVATAADVEVSVEVDDSAVDVVEDEETSDTVELDDTIEFADTVEFADTIEFADTVEFADIVEFADTVAIPIRFAESNATATNPATRIFAISLPDITEQAKIFVVRICSVTVNGLENLSSLTVKISRLLKLCSLYLYRTCSGSFVPV